jgi:hypothetical protein
MLGQIILEGTYLASAGISRFVLRMGITSIIVSKVVPIDRLAYRAILAVAHHYKCYNIYAAWPSVLH